MSEAEEFLRRNPTQYCATIGKDGRQDGLAHDDMFYRRG